MQEAEILAVEQLISLREILVNDNEDKQVFEKLMIFLSAALVAFIDQEIERRNRQDDTDEERETKTVAMRKERNLRNKTRSDRRLT